MAYADFEYLLSVALLVTGMLGMGATLRPVDFLNVARVPKAIGLLFLVQVVIAPLLAVALSRLLNLPSGIAIGLSLVAALPGGLYSNLVTYLGRGNVALSVSATAIASLTCLFTTPLVLRLAGSSEQLAELQMPVKLILWETFVCMIIPLFFGMAIRRFSADHHRIFSTLFIRLSVLVLIVFVIAALSSGRIRPAELGWRPPLAMLLFCVFTLWISYGCGALLRMSIDDRFTIGLECLVRNIQLGVLLKASIFPPGQSDLIGDGVLYVLLFYGALSVGIGVWEAALKRMGINTLLAKVRQLPSTVSEP